MKYQKIWDKVLGENERVEHEFSISSRYLNTLFFLWTVIGFCVWISPEEFMSGVMIVGIAGFYYLFYKKNSRAYAFTDSRIIVYIGWLSTRLISVDYNQITDIRIEEPFFSKLIYGTGVFQIATAGTGSPPVRFNHIDNPYGLKKKLDELCGKDVHNVTNGNIVEKNNFQSKEQELDDLKQRHKKEIKGEIAKETKKLFNPLCYVPGIGDVLDKKDDMENRKNRNKRKSEKREIKKKYQEVNL
ncbi:PH domain-containing protein [Patescibacteria group bacterium]|nr:PH domain-containing protein [Patescibacteria group bacterium]MBU1246920.1 PH domain-containing protein [Patescibacteria group bacterium]MBU1956050.1 PH domain-containing protein [Patescibacteria group bacterium]MBU2460723.1 PH domain-containing protein [Patescibacteria group bacterium]